MGIGLSKTETNSVVVGWVITYTIIARVAKLY